MRVNAVFLKWPGYSKMITKSITQKKYIVKNVLNVYYTKKMY